MESIKIGKEYSVTIVDHILDNIHGHIGLTSVEKEIERTSIFKRLLDISQLGLVNRIFPCALHNRYTHSIGVMYVADQMSQNMQLNSNERQLLRLAGLLHDIGHYPLSHNVEQAYKDFYKNKHHITGPLKWDSYCEINIPPILKESYKNDDDYKLKLSGSKNMHHEAIGAIIIKSNKEIRDKIKFNYITYSIDNKAYLNPFFAREDKDEYTDQDVEEILDCVLDDIAGIVTGDIQKESKYFEKYSLFVQIIHSEMDADNIDYLLRDATFSGTTYGIMDMGILINSLRSCRIVTPDKKISYILGIAPKGIGCVEQFLMNRYLAYTQIVFNKYVSILEAMMSYVMAWFLFDIDSGYTYRDIQEIAKMKDGDSRYLYFTDSYILNFINNFDFSKNNPSSLTKSIIRKLQSYLAFPVLDNKESIYVGTDYKRMCNDYQKDSYYNDIQQLNTQICEALEENIDIDNTIKERAFCYRFEYKKITDQLPRSEFKKIRDKYNKGKEKIKGCFNYDYDRLANGIPIIDNIETIDYSVVYSSRGKLPDLIVDTSKSALKDIHKLSYCVLRKYDVQ